MGALEEDKLTYCKTLLGKIEKNLNITKINANSITLNKKDIQTFGKNEKQFLALPFLCPIKDLKLIIDDKKCQLIIKKILEYYRKSSIFFNKQLLKTFKFSFEKTCKL